MDLIKESFRKVKEDIDSLKKEMASLSSEILDLKDTINNLFLTQKQSHSPENPSLNAQNPQIIIPTNQQSIPTHPTHPTHIPTDNKPFKPLKGQNLGISTGNKGVPTDKPTNQQTNQQTQNALSFPEKSFSEEYSNSHGLEKTRNSMNNALNILNSLDNIKKEIRLKFKELTDQEFRVFSVLYQMDEEFGYSDYRELSQRLNLSESSVRDYIGKLVKKDIPVEKIKINNKMVHLSVSPGLKKIASLGTILQLRDL